MKKKIFFAAAILMFSALFSLSAHADDITVTVNGKTVEMDTPATIVEDRTLVPLRAVSNALNCAVGWDPDTRGVIIYNHDRSITDNIVLCWIEHQNAFLISGDAFKKSYSMDVAPMIIQDRTYVPIRAISELLGAEVDWNSDTREVIITSQLIDNIATDADAESLIPFEDAVSKEYDLYTKYSEGTLEKINAEIELENGGKIELELYPELAPITVKNFVRLANEDFYNGLIFHRVISGFMIQGGGFDINGSVKQADTIKGEFLSNGIINLLSHDRGVISMARTPIKDSASSQFFIMHADYPFLNGNYAAFGKVTSGLEYVDAIADTKTDENDKPVENQVIKSITIIE